MENRVVYFGVDFHLKSYSLLQFPSPSFMFSMPLSRSVGLSLSLCSHIQITAVMNPSKCSDLNACDWFAFVSFVVFMFFPFFQAISFFWFFLCRRFFEKKFTVTEVWYTVMFVNSNTLPKLAVSLLCVQCLDEPGTLHSAYGHYAYASDIYYRSH